MWILQTDKTVLIGDEVDLATQLLNQLEMPMSLERLKHLAVAMTGCDIEGITITRMYD